MSQPKEATPKPAAQAPTGRPAQFEKASSASSMASKSGLSTTAKGGVAGGGITAGGSTSIGTTGKGSTKTKTETAPVYKPTLPSGPLGPRLKGEAPSEPCGPLAPTGTLPSGPRAPLGPIGTLPSEPCGPPGPRVTLPPKFSAPLGPTATLPPEPCGPPGPRATLLSQSHEPLSPTHFGARPEPETKVSPKDTVKSTTAITTVKADLPTLDPAKTSNLAAAAATTASGSVSVLGKKDEVKPTQPKVQVEVPPKAAAGAKEAPAVDPFDALANILPSADTIVRPEPVFTGPEVKEHDVISEEGHKCGEREDTLPPGYRLEDMPPPPADYKPPEVPKPLSTDEALDSLSAGFMSSSVPAACKKQEKKDPEVVSAACAGPANFAPAPVKQSKIPATVPSADKMKKGSDDFSLEAGLPSGPSAAACKFPPPDKRPKMEDVSCNFSLDSGLDAKANKPKTDTATIPVDALSALVDTLPADAPKPKLPELRPEDIVSEDKHKKEKGVLVGEREDTIHPDFRFNKEELEKLPAPKPEPTMGTGEALDFLSGDFLDCSAASAVKAPPVKVPCTGDKKADDFSLEAGLSASTAKKVESSALPPKAASTDKKVAEKAACGKDTTAGKPKTDKTAAIPMDALSALVDTLPADTPKPELPELRPEEIVSEDKHKKEKGVLVGEREDTIHPDFRFNKEELEKLPAPKPEPKMGTCEALDILSGDFGTPSAPPAVQKPVNEPLNLPPGVGVPINMPPVVCYAAEPGKEAPPVELIPVQSKVEDMSALDVLSEDFVAPNKASGVQCSLPTKIPEKLTTTGAPGQAKPKTDKADPMSLDALSALGSTLPADAPKPKLPELNPKDIVSEDKHKKEKGVLVGEREDTIHPDFRFNKEELEKLPAPKPEPKMSTGEAFDILSGDFMTSSAASGVQACACTPSAPPAQPSADFALDALAGDFVATTAAEAVKSAAAMPTESDPQLLAGADNALDALSDTLKDIQPAPLPAPVPVKDMVKEKKAVEEKLIKMGERDDSLPPEYRPTEEDLKKMAEEKAKAAAEPKEKPMDDKTALDLLSDDFTLIPQPTVPVVCHGAEKKKLEPPVLDSEPLKPMPGKVLDSMADTLLPDDPAFKSKTDKPKKQRAEDPSASDQLPAQPSSEVVATSSKKGGKR